MKNHKKTASTFVILITLVAVLATMTLRGQSQKEPTFKEQEGDRHRGMPVVDSWAPESPDSQTRSNRKLKGKRHDRQSSQPIEEAPSISGRIWSSHWSQGLTAIPADKSDTVLIGEILDAQAYFSNDKTGIYSEFTLLVEEALKGDAATSFPSGSRVTIERFGGAVRFPSGVIQRYETAGQRMPRIGRRYVLFLKRIKLEEDFSLITGYELRGGEVFPLDGASEEEGTQKFPFDEYEGFDATVFLKIVRDTIAQAPQVSSKASR